MRSLLLATAGRNGALPLMSRFPSSCRSSVSPSAPVADDDPTASTFVEGPAIRQRVSGAERSPSRHGARDVLVDSLECRGLCLGITRQG